ncbi:FGGY family carbohydrate kinase [Mycolicibacterium sp. BiH015]|uniref:FGGY family carbohydrate kinase n=1 Tax=Mycolicibacterium sp. BiH015 TaxID=3018808 RepID=UPI0022E101B7|nr:FGGY family carbohydrate kinase [Mycolicibacterium sp. BiH015]MDA2893294.1 FGGY family carbohydrate kinase [Mycolicibacterium sp. BiH015]
MTVLAIDQGTSGTKAIVVDDDGDVLAIAETAVRPRYLPGGGVEHDPVLLLESVLDTGRRAIAEAGAAIEAVSIANQGETVLAWNPETGRPLSPALVWQDRRAETLCGKHEHAKDFVAQRSGLVLDPYFSAPKMAWLRDNITADGVVTTTDTWLVHQLTGQFVTDTTTASRSLITNIDNTDWDSELIDLFGLGAEALPKIVENDAVVGETSAFGSPVSVGGLIVDQQAALLAQRCLTAGTAKATFGTGVFLLANVGPAPLRSSTGLTCSVAWTLRGDTEYCVDGQAYTAASAIRWITDLGLIDDATQLDSVAADDADGVLFVPALAGLAAPWWRPDASASWSGMTLSSTRGHLVAAVIDGLAAQTAELLGAVDGDATTPLSALRVDGGLTRSTRLMQAVANLTGLPVEVYPSAHATALGAAACARLACQPTLSVADAISPWTAPTSYEPRWSTERAADFRDRWRTAATATFNQGAS